MKRWLKIWAIGVGVIIVVTVLIGLALGSGYEVREEQTIKAPPRKIHPYVNNLHRWREQVEHGLRQQDPTVKVTLEGPEKGAGSTLRWSGDDIGIGHVTIVREDVKEGVWYEAAIRGDEVNMRAAVTYAVEGKNTNVAVHTEGDLPPVIGGYIASLVEEQLRAQITRGLEELKKEVE
jgi:hypothetical protein